MAAREGNWTLESSHDGKQASRQVHCLYAKCNYTKKQVRQRALLIAADYWFNDMNKNIALWLDGKRLSFTAEERQRMEDKARSEYWYRERIRVDSMGRDGKRVVSIIVGKWQGIVYSESRRVFDIVHLPTKREVGMRLDSCDHAIEVAVTYDSLLGVALDTTGVDVAVKLYRDSERTVLANIKAKARRQESQLVEAHERREAKTEQELYPGRFRKPKKKIKRVRKVRK